MPKEPQDHKKKASEIDEDVPESFSFTHDADTYTFKPTGEHIKPGFLRKYRNSSPEDAHYAMIELLADEDQLDIIDNMGWTEHRTFNQDFEDYVRRYMKGVGLGE